MLAHLSRSDFDMIDGLTFDDPVVCNVGHGDLAATANGGDNTTGCTILRLKSGRFVIAHVARGQWGCGHRWCGWGEGVLSIFPAGEREA